MKAELITKSETKEIMIQPRHIVIGVWATMGTGKSTLIEGLQEIWPDLTVIDEDYEGNPYLGPAYENPQDYSFDSQMWARLRKIDRYSDISPDKVSLIIPDGVDRAYAKTYRKRGYISDTDWETYMRLDRFSNKYLPKPDVNLFLTIEDPELVKRIIQRNRDEEKEVNPEFLLDLMKIMEDECFSAGAPVIIVNAEYQDFRRKKTMEEIAEGLEYQIYQLFKDKFNNFSSGVTLPPFIKRRGTWA